MTRLWLGLMLAVFVLPSGHPAEVPAFVDGFEDGVRQWTTPWEGKQPLVLCRDRAHSGGACAYSGPPGAMRVGQRDFALPFVGRVEVWFYDDMAAEKQQMAGVTGTDEELLGIACRTGESYFTRIGMTYTPTRVARKEGWHQLAWECDGRRTRAFIDGKEVAVNERLARIGHFSVGSYWDASTGWYDDAAAYPHEPAFAGPLVQGEDALAQGGEDAKPVAMEVVPGAVGQAVRQWSRPEHWLEWMVDATGAGPKALLLKYQAAGKGARLTCMPQPEGAPVAVTLAPTGEKWGYATVPVALGPGKARVRLRLEEGDVSLDWIAVAPVAPDEAAAYGAALDGIQAALPGLRRMAARIRAGATGIDALLQAPLPAGAQAVAARVDSARARLADAQQAAMRADQALLQGIFRTPPAATWGPETALSREYYRRLLRYVPYTRANMRDWPGMPGCRYHKVDNSGEHAVRQNATMALTYALLATLGDYDAALAGVPRETVRADLAGLLRYLGVTHSANYLPTGDGKPWGDAWQSAFWAGIAGQAAWMGWDLLDDETRLLIARMVEHEADRFNERPPDSGEWDDTKAEENAWNSEIVALAATMFPQHPHAKLWHERAIVYMMNSFSEEADKKDEKGVDGKPIKEWICTTNVHPDHTVENHGRVHPDYLSCFTLTMRNALLYRMAGREVPQSAYHHAADAYRVLKGLTGETGGLLYVNGQDWWPHRHDVPLMAAGLMSVLLNDPEGAFLERSTLDWTAKMHSRFADGRMWDRREFNYPNAEEEMMARYAELYLLHRQLGDGPAPVTREAFQAAQSGVKVLDIGGFVTHRTPAKFASFAWVNGAMGLIYPGDDTWFTGPWERGLTGAIDCEGLKDTTPKVVAHRVHTGFGGFAFIGRLERCQGKVEQGVAMVSLPEAPVLYLEILRAAGDVTVREAATGALGILNEDAAPVSPNKRTLYDASGATEVIGAATGPATLRQLASPWANVDGRLGVVSSLGRIAYRDQNAYSRSRLQDELYAGYRAAPGVFKEGQEIGTLAVAVIPGQTPEETSRAKLESARLGATGIAARFAGWIIAANPGAEPVSGEAFGRRIELEPLGAMIVKE